MWHYRMRETGGRYYTTDQLQDVSTDQASEDPSPLVAE